MSGFIARWLPFGAGWDTGRVTALDDERVPVHAYLDGPDWWDDGCREIKKFFRSPGPSSRDDGDNITVQAATREDSQTLGLEQQTSTEQSAIPGSDEDAEADEDYYPSPDPLINQNDNFRAHQVSFQPPKDLENVYLNDSMIPSSPLHGPIDEKSTQHVSCKSIHNTKSPSSAFENADNLYQHTDSTPLDFGVDPPSSPPDAVHDQQALQNQAAEPMDEEPTCPTDPDVSAPADHTTAPAPVETSRPMDYGDTVSFPPFPYSHVSPQAAPGLYDHSNYGQQISGPATGGVGGIFHAHGPGNGPRASPSAFGFRAVDNELYLPVAREHSQIPRLLPAANLVPEVTQSPASIESPSLVDCHGRNIGPVNDDLVRARPVYDVNHASHVTPYATLRDHTMNSDQSGIQLVKKRKGAILSDSEQPSAKRQDCLGAGNIMSDAHLLQASGDNMDIGQPALTETSAGVASPTAHTAHTIQSTTLPASDAMNQAPPTMKCAISKEPTLQTGEAYSATSATEQPAPNVDIPSRATSRQRKPRGTMSERELFALFPNKGYHDAPADVATRRSGAVPRTERQLLGSWRAHEDTTADAARGTTTGNNKDVRVGVDTTQRSRQSSSSSLSSLATIDAVPTPATRTNGPLLQEGNRKGRMEPPSSRSVSPTKRNINNIFSQNQHTGDDGNGREERKEASQQKRFSTPAPVTPAATSENTPVLSGTAVKLTPNVANRADQTAQPKPTRSNPTKSPYFPATATDTAGMSAQQKGWLTRKRKAEEQATKETADDHGSEDDLALLTPAPSSTSRSTAKLPTTTTKAKAKAKEKATPNTKTKTSATPAKRSTGTRTSTKAPSAATAPTATSKGPTRNNSSANNRAPPKRMLSELDAPPIANPSPLHTRHASSTTISSALAPAFGKAGSGANKTGTDAPPPINRALRKRMEDKAKNRCG